eukprot:scaffold217701_cov35-Tisochrysis_lutea.AAC.3
MVSRQPRTHRRATGDPHPGGAHTWGRLGCPSVEEDRGNNKRSATPEDSVWLEIEERDGCKT